MKNGYEILSPYFMKLAGFCVSIYLCIISVKLFVMNPENAYWHTNSFLVWSIILAAFFLCVLFFMFIFIKTDNSKVYLFSLYLLCCIKFVLFLFMFNMRLRTLSDANIMLKIVLCFGFLFIFLEFLHAQTSRNFIGEKTLIAGIIGTTSCIMTIYILTTGRVSSFINFLIFYLFYALHIFVFSLFGKKTKSSILFQCSFIAFSFVLTPMAFSAGRHIDYSFDQIVLLEVLAVLGCTQLIPSKERQTPNDITISTKQKLASRILSMFSCAKNNISYSNDLQPETFPIIKGVFMITVRFTYFALFAKYFITLIWRGL